MIGALVSSVELDFDLGFVATGASPRPIRTDSGWNTDIGWTAVSRFRRWRGFGCAGEVGTQRRSDPGGGGSPNSSSRAAKAVPHVRPGAIKRSRIRPLLASMTRRWRSVGAGSEVGGINPRPAHERRNQPVPLRLQAPFDLGGRRCSPRRHPLGRGRGDVREGDEPAKRRTRQAMAQRSIHPVAMLGRSKVFPKGDLKRRCGVLTAPPRPGLGPRRKCSKAD